MKTREILQKAFIALSLIAAFALTGCSGGGGDGGGGQPPSAPIGVSAAPGNGQAAVNWNAVAGAASYNIYMASVSGVGKGNYNTLQDGMKHTGVTSPFIHTGLTNGTTYYFVVTAVNSAGEGEESGEVQATPEEGLAASVNLPETGQTISYAARDDGALKKGISWPDVRFVGGEGTGADCITDELTGLIWVKAPDTATKTWVEALAYANNLTLCGYDDWRLPNVNELESLYNAGEPYSTDWLKAQGFSSTLPEDQYWSSTTYASDLNVAWSVVMWNGDVDRFSKSFPFYAWPVRSTQAGIIQLPKTGQTTSYATGDDGELKKGNTWPSPRFTAGTGAAAACVTDNLTGLVWVKGPDATMRTWDEALAYSNDHSLCGYTDWRLPNRKELRSLVNYGEANPTAWLNTQGFSDVQTASYWSSTTYAFDPELAWPDIMEDGRLFEDYKYSYGYAWPVRGGQ